MYIEIVRTGNGASAAAQQPEMQLAGGEPGRIRPAAGTHIGMAADTVRPLRPGATDGGHEGHALLVRVDGQTVVEMAGFADLPGVLLEGGGWMPAARTAPSPQPPTMQQSAAPSFFGQATNDTAPLLGGTAEAGSLVVVGVGGAIFCVTAGDSGAWELDTSSAVPMSGRFDLGADGEKTLIITSVDAGGNSTGVSGTFVLDTVPPPAPVLTSCQVDSPTPVLQGRAEAGSSVMVDVGGAVYATAADSQGCWSVDTARVRPGVGEFALGEDGPKHLSMTSTDAAGNTSSADASFLLDTRAASQVVPMVAAHGPHAGRSAAHRLPSVADVTQTMLSAFGRRAGRPPRQQQVG